MAAEADLAAQLATAVVAAEAAVARTPEQLPILAAAQVVDSGGYGLLTMLRGCRGAMGFVPPLLHDSHLLGVDRVRAQVAAGNANPAGLVAAPTEPYGLCVTLLVEAPGTDELAVRRRLEELGSSVLVVASGSQLKMHLHVPDPSVALDYAATLGTILRSDISDIDEQASGVDAALALPIVAVADGEGLTRLFRSLGASVLAGGPANNPSTADLLAACDEVAACHDRAFLLPNHPNILPGARQAAELRSTLRVVPSAGIPHGIAAALAFEPGAPDDQNLELMTLAAARVCAAELTRAARAATLGGVTVARGELMVMVDGQLLGTGESGLGKLLERAAARQPELATIYYGAAVAEADAEELAIQLRAGLPGLAVEIVRGDQPRAEYLLSFE
jgi:dihydroxyacetone kinase-like predicted kinase